MLQYCYIDGEHVNIWPEENGRVTIITSDGEEQKNLRPVRLFPLTQPASFISFFTSEGEEVGVLRDINELDSESRAHLDDILNRFYLIPRIEEIHELKEEYGITHWKVTTDRGRRDFEVRSRSTDIKVLPPRRVLIRDSDDNQYEIPDYSKLPLRSKMLLEGET